MKNVDFNVVEVRKEKDIDITVDGVTYKEIFCKLEFPGGIKIINGRPEIVKPIPYWYRTIWDTNAELPDKFDFLCEPDTRDIKLSGGYVFKDYDVVLSSFDKDDDVITCRHLVLKKV